MAVMGELVALYMWLYVLCSLGIVSGTAVRDPVPVTSNSTIVTKELGMSRIAGGYGVRMGRYPFIVQIVPEDSRFEFCGGAIVSKDHILTAAHCVDSTTPDMIGVKAGSNELGEGTDIPIADVLLHPEYDRNFNRDIAILTAMDSITFTDDIKPALIAPADQEEFDFVIVAGWGEGGQVPELSDELSAVTLTVLSPEDCKNNYFERANENTFCTDYFRDREGPCTGDDGDPAIFPGPDRLVGLVSVPSLCRGGAIVMPLYTAIAGPAIHSFILENTDAVEAMDF